MTVHIDLYPSQPNKGLPIAFAVIASVLALVHFYHSFFRYKWIHFGCMITWASMVWISGFVSRAVSVFDTENVGLYICQYILVITGPVLFAASEYFILGRLLAYLPYHTPIHPGRVLSTFLLLSAAVESLTASGASLLAGNKQTSQVTTGLNLVKAALILQTVLEASFFSLVALIQHRCRKARHFRSNVRVICYVLYITSFMMLVRCIFRAVQGFEETSCPPDNYNCSVIDRNEWFLWVFEVANITVFVTILAVFPPGKYLPRDVKIYLDPFDGQTERLGPGFAKAVQRSFVATVLDPVDISGMVTGKAAERMDKFWERENPVAEKSKGRSGTWRQELC